MNKGSFRPIAAALALAVLSLVSVAAVPAPAKVDDIPVYIGAVSDAAIGKSAMADAKAMASGDSKEFSGIETRAFMVSGVPGEEVFLFYMGKFGLSIGKEGNDGFGPGPEVGEFDLKYKSGTTSRIRWRFERTTEVGQTDGKGSNGGDEGGDGETEAWHKKVDYISKANKEQRKAMNGIYFGSGVLSWYCVEAGKKIRRSDVEIEDRSFRTLKYDPKASLTISTWIYPAPAVAEISAEDVKERERAAAEEKASAEKRAVYAATIPTGEPTAAYLGFAPYPGSVYDKQFGDRVHAGGDAQFMWTSGDPVAKVAGYFTKAVGAKPMVSNESLSLFQFQKGKNSVQIVVQANPDGGAATKSVIQIVLTPLGG
jgi:hypothetical protein